jgi:dephospho-CoA kinase
VITAPPKVREARARVPIAARSDRLLPDEEKAKRADYVYVNTGTLEDLDAWVAGVMEELRAAREPASR